MTAPILSIRSLSAVSELEDHAPILRNVSLDLAPGETLGLVGESGAGKSTIVKARLGVLPRTIRITQGEILFEGERAYGAAAARNARDLRRCHRAHSAGPDDRSEPGATD
jgi:peptide/nickel transport system ATP-binding protein